MLTIPLVKPAGDVAKLDIFREGDMFFASSDSERRIKVQGLPNFGIINDISVPVMASHKLRRLPLLETSFFHHIAAIEVELG